MHIILFMSVILNNYIFTLSFIVKVTKMYDVLNFFFIQICDYDVFVEQRVIATNIFHNHISRCTEHSIWHSNLVALNLIDLSFN